MVVPCRAQHSHPRARLRFSGQTHGISESGPRRVPVQRWVSVVVPTERSLHPPIPLLLGALQMLSRCRELARFPFSPPPHLTPPRPLPLVHSNLSFPVPAACPPSAPPAPRTEKPLRPCGVRGKRRCADFLAEGRRGCPCESVPPPAPTLPPSGAQKAAGEQAGWGGRQGGGKGLVSRLWVGKSPQMGTLAPRGAEHHPRRPRRWGQVNSPAGMKLQ